MSKRFVEDELRSRGALLTGPLGRMLSNSIRRGLQEASRLGHGEKILLPPIGDPEFEMSRVGAHMESTAEMLKAATDALRDAKEELQRVSNEAMATAGPLEETLLKHLRDIRDSRMAAVREAREILAALQDVRKFFVDKDYDREMERMERLVRVCREFQALKADGVLDAMIDAALKLAAGPEPKA